MAAPFFVTDVRVQRGHYLFVYQDAWRYLLRQWRDVPHTLFYKMLNGDLGKYLCDERITTGRTLQKIPANTTSATVQGIAMQVTDEEHA